MLPFNTIKLKSLLLNKNFKSNDSDECFMHQVINKVELPLLGYDKNINNFK